MTAEPDRRAQAAIRSAYMGGWVLVALTTGFGHWGLAALAVALVAVATNLIRLGAWQRNGEFADATGTAVVLWMIVSVVGDLATLGGALLITHLIVGMF